MSMNYAFGFSLFLLLLVALNLYFFYTLNSVGKNVSSFNMPSIKLDMTPSIFKDIYDHLNYLPNQYKTKNPKFNNVQKNLIRSFNATTSIVDNNVWRETQMWSSEDSLFPFEDGASGRILNAIRSSQIAYVDNAPKGTQLKLLLLVGGKQKIYFKPRRYKLNDIINGNIYAGFDRHNSEVLAYYLAMVLNFKWIAPSVIRKIHVYKDVIPNATKGLKRTMIKTVNGNYCIYGKCFYCKANETVCPDENGEIEGAAILYLDKTFKVLKSPWRRSYNKKKMEWEKDNDFCKKISGSLSVKRLLNLVDVSIFDFLIQNGDRHRYEVYKDKILLLDNGKGFGNPMVDELDILAPLYQCCIVIYVKYFNKMSLENDTFLYYAYGSNLLKRRIHINNPSAEFIGIGKLDDHHLDFIKYSDHWRGTSATIIPIDNTYVWGAIWKVHMKDMPALDRQEGVDTNWYFPKTVNVTTEDGTVLQCRTYQQTINPPACIDHEELPLDRRPSITYLDCIIKGAIECNLPEGYIDKLKRIPHNGQDASPKMIQKLKL